MCGISGIIGPRHPATAERRNVAERMSALLSHRGPDGEGIAQADWFVFAHRRLAIIDLATGAQPMECEDGRYCICFNGEIYNYVELRQEMVASGSSFSTASDTEVLLKLIASEGAGALSRVNGMFAFAWADRKTGRWLLARDPFGIKPLYYATVGEDLIFASEIKALLAHPGIRAQVNWRSLQHYMTFQFCLGGQTLFGGIRSLEPGHYISGDHGSSGDPVCYWDTNYVIDHHHTPEYFHERLAALLQDTARLQVRSDVPLGAYLSGGLDSSVIAAQAAGQLGEGVPVFHGRFAEGAAYDESVHARAVAEHIRAEYHEVVPTAADFVEHLPRLVYALDEPVAGPGLFPQFMVSRMAASRVKVVLGGQGGDEIFGGYARYLIGYLEQALKGAIYETQEEGKHLVTLASIIPNLSLLKEYQPLLQQLWQKGLFEEMDRRYFRLIDRSPDAEALLSGDALAEFDRAEVFADFQRVFNHPDTKSYLNKMTHFDQKTLLVALLQIEDRMSMAVSLESRVPFLDTRIVDLVTTMPPPMKFQGGRTKHILKQTVRGMLPDSVIDRKDKMGFPVPLASWVKRGVVRDFVTDTLMSQSCRERGLFSKDSIEKLVNGSSPGFRQLWGAVCLELWHQRFIDQPL